MSRTVRSRPRCRTGRRAMADPDTPHSGRALRAAAGARRGHRQRRRLGPAGCRRPRPVPRLRATARPWPWRLQVRNSRRGGGPPTSPVAQVDQQVVVDVGQGRDLVHRGVRGKPERCAAGAPRCNCCQCAQVMAMRSTGQPRVLLCSRAAVGGSGTVSTAQRSIWSISVARACAQSARAWEQAASTASLACVSWIVRSASARSWWRRASIVTTTRTGWSSVGWSASKAPRSSPPVGSSSASFGCGVAVTTASTSG